MEFTQEAAYAVTRHRVAGVRTIAHDLDVTLEDDREVVVLVARTKQERAGFDGHFGAELRQLGQRGRIQARERNGFDLAHLAHFANLRRVAATARGRLWRALRSRSSGRRRRRA